MPLPGRLYAYSVRPWPPPALSQWQGQGRCRCSRYRSATQRVELLENVGQVFRRDADAVIFHVNRDAGVPFRSPYTRLLPRWCSACEYLAAFCSRFINTCSRRRGSASINGQFVVNMALELRVRVMLTHSRNRLRRSSATAVHVRALLAACRPRYVSSPGGFPPDRSAYHFRPR